MTIARAAATPIPADVRKILRGTLIADAHGFFEVGDGAADGNLGHAVGAGGGGKAIEFDHARKDRELSCRP